MLFRLGIALLIFGGILGFFTIQEGRLAATASAVPQEITLQQLIARGPAGNAHIILKDFEFGDNSVYQADEHNNASWNKVWVPVVPRQGNQDVAAGRIVNLQAIVKSSKVKNAAALDQFVKTTTLQGMVTNRIDSLGSEERGILQQSYPQTDFSKCLIIEDGRKPSSSGVLLLMCAGTLVLFAGGAGLLVLSFRRR
jgi:hypothetical protein